MTFGEKLQELRKARGWSQEELAGQIHVSRQALSKWESGGAVPDTENIIALSRLFGVTTDYLLGRDSQKSNELTPTQREEIATQKWLSLDKEKRDALLQMMETCIKTFEAAESNHKK